MSDGELINRAWEDVENTAVVVLYEEVIEGKPIVLAETYETAKDAREAVWLGYAPGKPIAIKELHYTQGEGFDQ